jgi:hypothetical protein
MPANSIRIASASEGTMIRWLANRGQTSRLYILGPCVYIAECDGRSYEATTALKALRKLCREVKKQDGKA